MDENDKLKSSIFFVEATFFEQFSLWKEYHKKIDWEEDNSGLSQVIGSIGDKPVCVTFYFAKIYGKRICFYCATSRYVDHVMVEDFITQNYPVRWDNGRRIAMSDAQNFHHAMDACKTANLKQWERKKKLNKIDNITY